MLTQEPRSNSEQDIDREALIRALVEEMDNAVRVTGLRDHKALLQKIRETKMRTPIYRILTQEHFDAINVSKDAIERQFDILISILPDLLEKLDANSIYLLRSAAADTPGALQLLAHVERETYMPRVDDANTAYSLSENAWRSLGNYKGVEILFHLPSKTSVKGASPLYQLPMPTYDAEVAIVRVGDFYAHAKFLLVIHKALSDDPASLTYAKDLHDLFDLLILRLHELHHAALHRSEEISYDNKRTEFMQDVLHQIRNSVGGLLEHIEFLLKTNRDTAIYEELDLLYKAVRVLSDAAESSYLATEKRSIFEVYTEPMQRLAGKDWLQLLREYSAIFAGQVEARGLKGILIDEASIRQFPPVEASLPLVKLVIFNLLQNALKYSRHDSGTPIRIKGLVQDNFIKIVFTNYGVGIDLAKNEEERIFERHYRSLLVKENHRTGTGIGLYLCRAIMREHGGDTMLESIQNVDVVPGLTEVSFSIRLPIVEDYEPAFIAPAQAGKPTILYVEDRLFEHRYSIFLLERHFRVLHAYTGKHALEYLRADRSAGRHDIRLILLDIDLEDDNDRRFSGVRGGVELAKAILQEEKFDLPIIGWTGNLMPQILKELNDIGVEHILGRTQIPIEQLSEIIKETIERYSKEPL